MHGQLTLVMAIAWMLPPKFCLTHIARHVSLSYNCSIKRIYVPSAGGDNFEISVFSIFHDAIPPPVYSYCEVLGVDKMIINVINEVHCSDTRASFPKLKPIVGCQATTVIVVFYDMLRDTLLAAKYLLKLNTIAINNQFSHFITLQSSDTRGCFSLYDLYGKIELVKVIPC